MEKIVKIIKEITNSKEIFKLKDKQYNVVVEESDVVKILTRFKDMGYKHLSLISVVDWIEQNKFEIIYNIYSYDTKIHLLISTYIDRKKAKTGTIKSLWPIAQTYEREIYEMFGIEFIGNDDKRPFILEGWKGKPPMRKDFDLNKYAKKKFERRKYA